MKRASWLLVVLFGLAAVGCAGKGIETFKGKQPRVRPEDFFDGRVTGYGYTETRFGSIREWFEAEFRGEKKDGIYVWHETLTFEDDRTDTRTWRIVPDGEHQYEVEATGMAGTGTGVAYGNAVRWNYYLNRTIGGVEWTFWVDDWMYKKDDNTMIVRATFSWFGMRVGRAHMFLRKVD